MPRSVRIVIRTVAESSGSPDAHSIKTYQLGQMSELKEITCGKLPIFPELLAAFVGAVDRDVVPEPHIGTAVHI